MNTSARPTNATSSSRSNNAWPALKPLKGAELEVHYVETLRALGTEKGSKGKIRSGFMV